MRRAIFLVLALWVTTSAYSQDYTPKLGLPVGGIKDTLKTGSKTDTTLIKNKPKSMFLNLLSTRMESWFTRYFDVEKDSLRNVKNINIENGLFQNLTVTGTASFPGNVVYSGLVTLNRLTVNDSIIFNGNLLANAGTFRGNLATLGVFTGNGSGITDLNASNLSSGLVPTSREGTGTANSTTFLRGDQKWVRIDTTQSMLGGPSVKVTVNTAEAQYAFPDSLPDGKGYEVNIVSSTKNGGYVLIDVNSVTKTGFKASATVDGVALIYRPVWYEL